MPAHFRFGAPPLALLALLALVPSAATAGSTAPGSFPYQAPSYAGLYDDEYRRPLDGSYRYAPPAEVAQWGGLYVGAHLGAGYGGSDLRGLGVGDIDTGGFLGGLLVGYNFQMGSIVGGLEADVAWSGIDGSDSNASSTATAGYDWLSSMRFRIGYAFGNWLAYGTAGLAFSNFWLEAAEPGLDLSQSDSLLGYALGAGVEYQLSRGINFRAEALYFGFEDAEFAAGGSDVTADPGVTTIRAGVSIKLN